MTHKYETSNNVKGWKMMLTQRSDAQKEVDKKFKMYKQIAKQAEESSAKMNQQYEEQFGEIRKQLGENDKQTKQHKHFLKQSCKEKLQNGSYAEYANLVTSILNSEHLNNEHHGK